MKKKETYKVLIAGAGSYIGTALEEELLRKSEQYEVVVLDMKNKDWRKHSLKSYDSIVFVAGLVHRKEQRGELARYRQVNTLLPIEMAEKAKYAGVGQFIFLSSMSVYGKQRGRITRADTPKPNSYYGRTKWEAEQGLQKMEEAFNKSVKSFQIAILRPPMVYGKGCKGNYPRLRRLALNIPLFPNYPNYRSMIYIGNLTAVLEQIIRTGKGGLYTPQNTKYVSTKQMVEEVAAYHQKKIIFSRLFHPFIRLLEKRSSLVQKVFGDLVYTQDMNVERSWLPYRDFAETIRLTEREGVR